MEHDGKYLKGFLSGVCVMLVCVGIVLFAKGEMLKNSGQGAQVETEARTEEQEKDNMLDLDLGRVENKLQNIEEVINQYYLDEIDEAEVESWMYKGLIAGLGDRYAAYYTREELEKSNESSSGQYEGIGAVLTENVNTGLVTVVRCYEGTPSQEAGMLPGDVIYMLNDTAVTGMELSDVVSMIRNEEGETIKVTVVREGQDDYLEFDVERRAIEVPTVNYEMMDGKIGYIEITEFDSVTEAQFINALEDLNSQGMEKLIIDLRNNLGGVLQTTCNMLNQLLPEGLIVYTEDKDGNRTEYRSDGKHAFDKPLAVLVNGNSASASEIFAGAVKDYGIGTLVGTNTYGKGIVQRTVKLNDGTAVKMTIAKYYTPKGNDIHGVGIKPDVEVELDDALKQKVSVEKSEDNQLQKAIEVVNGK